MPKTEKHFEISIQRTGKPYTEVHEWIDDPEHKDKRHDITKILEVAGMFEEEYGPEAARKYVQHLADDINGKLDHLVEDVQAIVDKTLSYFGTKN